jgi:endo-1,4-beta-D-glucanase Y
MSISAPRFRRTEGLMFVLAGALCAASCTSPVRSDGDTGNGGSTGGATGGGNGSGGSVGATGGSLGATGGATGSGGAVVGSGGAGGRLSTGGSAGSGATGGIGGIAGTGGTSSTGTGGAGNTGTGGAAGAGSGTGGAPLTIPGAGQCAAPAGASVADATAAYNKWKTDLVVSDGARGFLRVRRPNSSGAIVDSTVSEGIAYGMLLSVYANDQNTFDNLWKYEQLFPDNHGLMNWYIGPDGTVQGTGAATDADEDMAFALIMADKRWGGQGTLSTTYLAAAKTLIGLIWQYEVDASRNHVLTSGDQSDGSVINISYFAPAYYRAFGRVANTASNWKMVIDTSYTVISATLNAQNGNTQNGLVPAWSTPAGVPMTPPGTGMPLYHQLDSCRTPFRLGQDYCWNAEPRALTYLQKITGFYSGVGVANMVDGYDLNGTPHPQFVTTGGPRAASFVGPAGVGAMATGTTYVKLRDDAYASVATLTDLAGSTYYQESWTALSLQMMTGLLQDLEAP